MTDPTAEWISYTPATAREILRDLNPRNRKLRDVLVERYAADMAAGDWLVNGETIKFDTSGALIDGQHRLAAVVRAADTVPRLRVRMLTVEGLDPAAQNVTDTGLKRTPGDVLHLAGIKNANNLASMIRALIRVETGRAFVAKGSRQMVTNSEMLHWLQAHPESMRFMDETGWRIRRSGVPHGPGSAAFWMLHQLDLWAGAEFLERLVTLTDLPKGSPILTLNHRITSLRVNRSRLEATEWMAMVFTAWNAWVRDEPLPRLPERRGWTADTFPWPVSPAEGLREREAAAATREGLNVAENRTSPRLRAV